MRRIHSGGLQNPKGETSLRSFSLRVLFSISLQSDGVDINHFAVFDLNIALEAAQQRGNRIHRGQARDGTLYRGTADVYRAKLRMTALDRGSNNVVDLAGLDQVDVFGDGSSTLRMELVATM